MNLSPNINANKSFDYLLNLNIIHLPKKLQYVCTSITNEKYFWIQKGNVYWNNKEVVVFCNLLKKWLKVEKIILTACGTC